MKLGFLILENGEIFEGRIPDWQKGFFCGEVVFTTGMCGYSESLTDPSFSGQILAFTYPLIGNYGIAHSPSWESSKIQAAGVVVSQSCENWSHHSGLASLSQWLEQEQIPLITEVDTRALTKVLRSKGTMRGWINDAPQKPASFSIQAKLDKLMGKRVFGTGPKKITVVDCGIKMGIMRELERLSLTITLVPKDYDYSEEDFDAVFLSNGPGDPQDYVETIAIVQKAMKKQKPIYGVCLGLQLMARAAGAQTYKLAFGHRGQNQPCIELKSNKCYITSQNHGYAVDENTLNADWEVTFRNLNDGSVEGIAHKEFPFYSVQFHPEASPGPTDTQWFFEKFWQTLKRSES